MATFDDDLSKCTALVVDGNPTSRSILVGQLREFGMGSVSQAARAVDARRQLEFKSFDFVLCELHFSNEDFSGQDLLDDLRRNQLMPFSTIFIMITGEATYAKVAEAAESALDGYLLKPHKAAHLGERLRQARVRKLSLQGIFSAIEAEDFATAARLLHGAIRIQGPVLALCCTGWGGADAAHRSTRRSAEAVPGRGGGQDPALGQAGGGALAT
jgi:CheY-like chemotaxis protein